MNKSELLYPVENAYRQHLLLDGIWFFAFQKEGASGWDQGIPKEMVIPVPANVPEVFLRREECEYVGPMWFQKEAFVPKSWLGQDVFLRFDGVAHRFVVYVNGIEVARVEDGYLPNSIEITRHLRYGDMNAIIVKVNNELSDKTIPKGATFALSNGDAINVNQTDIVKLGGITKSVHLYAAPNTRIMDYQVKTLSVSDDKAEIHYSVHVQGNCLVTATLRNREGKVVATGVGGNATLTVDQPHLWSINNGYLYRIDFEVSRLGKQSDTYSITFGIRTLTCEKGKLLLNNKPIYLKALRIEQYIKSIAELANDTIMTREIMRMKSLGYNCIITGEYPLSEEIIRLAELQGILIIDEMPLASLYKKQEKSYVANFGEEEDDVEVKDVINQDLMSRDKYAASIFSYAICLPPLTPGDGSSEAYANAIVLQMQKEEHYGRLYSLELNLQDTSIPDSIIDQAQLIIIMGLDQYKPHQTKEGHSLGEALHRYILELQHRFPDKAILVDFDVYKHKEGQVYTIQETYDFLFKALHNESNMRGEVITLAMDYSLVKI